MKSAGATGSLLMTSAHPAARKTGSRTGRITTIANAATAGAAKIAAHFGRTKIFLRFIGTMSPVAGIFGARFLQHPNRIVFTG
jgi:hypothetical protein